MKFRANPIEQFADFESEGIFRPSDEVAPVILGLFPKDFDHVQLWTIGWQIAEEGIELLHPAQGKTVIQAMVNPRIVQNDESRDRFGDTRNQIFHEIDECFAVDRSKGQGVMQPLSGEIQSPHGRHPLVISRRHRMRATNRRPGALHGRRSRESRFVVIEQRATALLCPTLQTGKFRLAGGKSFRVAVFFRLIRVRLKLKPDFLRITPKRSSDSGKGRP